MAYGVTNTGFVRKRLDEILDDINTGTKSVFGADTLVGPEDPLGQINAIVAEELSLLWQAAEFTYNSAFPNKAVGTQLDDVSSYSGTKRNEAVATTATVVVSGTAGVSVLAGEMSISSSDYNNRFYNSADFTIESGGTVDVEFVAENTGPIPASAGTLTIINTPINGIVSVNNPQGGVVGVDRESDPMLRVRRKRSVALASGYGLDALYAAIGEVDGVTDINILVNESETTDQNGIPEHSFMPIVSGGDINEIAAAISAKKAIGITSHGSTVIQVPDVSGKDQPIGIHRPTPVTIYVRVTATALPGISSTAEADIKQAIVDYANGDLVKGRGFFAGDDVIFFELYTPINQVDNISVTALEVGYELTPDFQVNWITSDIPITDLERSDFTIGDITVMIT